MIPTTKVVWLAAIPAVLSFSIVFVEDIAVDRAPRSMAR